MTKNQNQVDAIFHLEMAAMMLLDLEKTDSKFSVKLDKIYLQLVSLYLQSDDRGKAKQLLNVLELRLEGLAQKDAYGYKMMNELANTLLEHELAEEALSFYRKALICMKRRHKNQYDQKMETARILQNMAKVLETAGKVAEARTANMQALEVWARSGNGLACQEMAKIEVHMAKLALEVDHD